MMPKAKETRPINAIFNYQHARRPIQHDTCQDNLKTLSMHAYPTPFGTTHDSSTCHYQK